MGDKENSDFRLAFESSSYSIMDNYKFISDYSEGNPKGAARQKAWRLQARPAALHYCLSEYMVMELHVPKILKKRELRWGREHDHMEPPLNSSNLSVPFAFRTFPITFTNGTPFSEGSHYFHPTHLSNVVECMSSHATQSHAGTPSNYYQAVLRAAEASPMKLQEKSSGAQPAVPWELLQ